MNPVCMEDVKQEHILPIPIQESWHPTDFGFYGDINRPDVYYNGSYELRSCGNDMWLLRRKKNKGNITQQMVKFYYVILQTDYEFANWLLNKRLNKLNESKNK